MSEKVRRLEVDVDEQHKECKAEIAATRNDAKNFVTYNHLDAVIEPIKDTLNVVQKDVKEILRAVSSKVWPKG